MSEEKHTPDPRNTLYDNLHKEMVRVGGLTAREQGKLHGMYIATHEDPEKCQELYILSANVLKIEKESKDDDISTLIVEWIQGVLDGLKEGSK